MSDIIPDIKPKGIFSDPQGDFSSGRVVKIGSFFMAVLLAIVLCVIILITSKDKPADPAVINAISISIGVFLGIAGANEIVQKITKT